MKTKQQESGWNPNTMRIHPDLFPLFDYLLYQARISKKEYNDFVNDLVHESLEIFRVSKKIYFLGNAKREVKGIPLSPEVYYEFINVHSSIHRFNAFKVKKSVLMESLIIHITIIKFGNEPLNDVEIVEEFTL